MTALPHDCACPPPPFRTQPVIAMTPSTHADPSSMGAPVDTTEILVAVAAAVILGVVKRLL